MSDIGSSRATAGRTRRPADVTAIIMGLAVLALGMVAVRDGMVGSLERSLFEAINGLPGWLYALAWPVQQVGALVVGPLVALVAALARRFRLALALLLATAAKLILERAIKLMVSRQRPGTSIGGSAELRGDVSPRGESFVSGHAFLVAAVAGVLTPYLPGRWKVVPWLLLAGAALARVYVGAHNPLDVICGAAIGVATASCINLVLGVPAGAAPAEERDLGSGGE